ncbi:MULTISPECIES: hypothetical protein [Amycolatopsis]|uniref:Uncharacterized protein n=1 Tax=Amycolatopsis albidoflavus TaxID=102226 RepID=A0ABW5IBG4_9PSEU
MKWSERAKGLSPVPGSPLSGDDRISFPYQVSHGVRGSLAIATEHIDALNKLVSVSEVLHPSAPFTLVRGAIEAASAALWMLTPKQRSERVLRRLRFLAKDLYLNSAVLVELGVKNPPSVTERTEKLLAIARRASGDTDVKLTRPTSTEIVREASSASQSSLNVLAAWQVCSGFAHGMPWAGLGMLEKEQSETDDERVVSLRLSSSLDRVLWATRAAMDVIEKAHAECVRMSQDYIVVA